MLFRPGVIMSPGWIDYKMTALSTHVLTWHENVFLHVHPLTTYDQTSVIHPSCKKNKQRLHYTVSKNRPMPKFNVATVATPTLQIPDIHVPTIHFTVWTALSKTNFPVCQQFFSFQQFRTSLSAIRDIKWKTILQHQLNVEFPLMQHTTCTLF